MTQQKTNSELWDKMETILFKAIEETIGRADLDDALKQIIFYPPAAKTSGNSQFSSIELTDISHLHVALEKVYGQRGSQGLALRSGRACFKYGLREFGPQFGLTDPSFRLLPLNLKIVTAAQQFSAYFNQESHKRVRVEEKTNNFQLSIENCPICRGRRSETAICHMAVGLLQEALYWISGGKYFHIEETDCIAKGDPRCTLVILKQPLE